MVGDRRDRALVGLQHLDRDLARVSGSSAPRQRRGRNGLIGVSASSGALIGMIGPCAERL